MDGQRLAHNLSGRGGSVCDGLEGAEKRQFKLLCRKIKTKKQSHQSRKESYIISQNQMILYFFRISNLIFEWII